MALLRGIAKIAPNQGNLTVAHLNHNLRGAESEADQRLVEELGKYLSIRVVAERLPANAIAGKKSHIGLESAARSLRYDFLRRTAESIGARYVLTAHTADDQAETVLHNICRGTGLAGVAGIPFTRQVSEAVTVVRPFLTIWKSEILSYLDQISQPFRTDTSNESTSFTRNRIRQTVMPLIEREINGSARMHIVRVAKIAREAVAELDRAANRLDASIVFRTETEVSIDSKILAGSSEMLVVHFLKRIWRTQGWPARQMDVRRWRLLSEMVHGAVDTASVAFPGGIHCQRANDNIFRLFVHGESSHDEHR